jgi:hypothetical protein
LCNWIFAYEECQSFFLTNAQFTEPVQALAALANLPLPFQWRAYNQSQITSYPKPELSDNDDLAYIQQQVCIASYIRHLIISGLDSPPALRAFFGKTWKVGVGNILNSERRKCLLIAGV